MRAGRCLGRLLLALPFLAAAASSPRADDFRLLGDWTYSQLDARIDEQATTGSSNHTSERFNQQYRLDMDKELFPTLRLDAGAQLETTDIRNTIDGDLTEFTDTGVRPYAEVELQTPLFTLAGGYQEIMVKNQSSNLATTREYTRTYSTRGEWRPTLLPSLEANFAHTNRHDQPLTRDTDTEILRLVSRYDYQSWDFLYSYLRSEEQRKLERSRTLNNIHSGRARYARSFMQDSLTLNGSLRLEHSALQFSGSGSRMVRTVPSGVPFFLLNDPEPTTNLPDEFTPVTPDQPLTAVNLGQGGGINQVSCGLAFGEAVQTDLVRLLPLEDATNPALATPAQIATVAGLLVWRVFVSRDQQQWQETTVIAASYDALDNQFEIRFAPVAGVLFLKVLTTPLNLTQVGKILLSDIQAFVTLSSDRGNAFSSDYYNAAFGLSWQADPKTTLLYDLSWQQRSTDLFADRRTRLTHALNLLRRFDPIYSGAARLQLTDTWRQGDHDATLVAYGAQLSARYLETLNQTLTYSGGYNREEAGDSATQALILRTNAKLYPGWDISFDQGYSWQSGVDGPDTSDFFVRLLNSIVPHRRLTLSADYAIRWNLGGGSSARSEYGVFRGTWVPTDTLSLTWAVRSRSSDSDSSTYWEYGLNWLPLRDGTLQCNLSYYETGSNEDDLARSLSPSLLWEVSRNASLTLSYTRGIQESRSESIDYATARANFRIYFN